MKISNFEYPKSSFLSTEKDTDIIINAVIDNERLKKLLFYTCPDCLKQPALTDEQSAALFNRNIKIIPKVYVDDAVLNYLIISFSNFITSGNPEYRNNFIEFDILCHYDQWQLDGYALRPYKIAAELDSMFNNKKLTGIGTLQFVSANPIVISDEYAGLCLKYLATHGDEDKIKPINPNEVIDNG